LSVEELDRLVDEILSKAEEEKNRVIASARARAREILEKPIPVEDYKREAEEILSRAKAEAERVVREAEEAAKRIKSISNERLGKAVALLLEYVLGLKG